MNCTVPIKLTLPLTDLETHAMPTLASAFLNTIKYIAVSTRLALVGKYLSAQMSETQRRGRWAQEARALATAGLIGLTLPAVSQNTQPPTAPILRIEAGMHTASIRGIATASQLLMLWLLGSAVTNWGPYYIKATRDALDGKWVAGSAWWGVKEGAVDLVSIAADVPADLRKRVESVKAGLISGSRNI